MHKKHIKKRIKNAKIAAKINKKQNQKKRIGRSVSFICRAVRLLPLMLFCCCIVRNLDGCRRFLRAPGPSAPRRARLRPDRGFGVPGCVRRRFGKPACLSHPASAARITAASPAAKLCIHAHICMQTVLHLKRLSACSALVYHPPAAPRQRSSQPAAIRR